MQPLHARAAAAQGKRGWRHVSKSMQIDDNRNLHGELCQALHISLHLVGTLYLLLFACARDTGTW